METDFDIKWFFDDGTYYREYLDAMEEFFPTSGMAGSVYIADVDAFHESMHKVKALSNDIVKLDSISEGGTGFHVSFEDYYLSRTGVNMSLEDANVDKDVFEESLHEYLCGEGSIFAREVVLTEELDCQSGTKAELQIISFPYRHKA